MNNILFRSIISVWASLSENWQSAADYRKWLKFGKWINNFYWWDTIKIIFSVGKGKVQFTLTFYLKQNKKVQLDLQHFEIFIFLSFPPGTMLEEKLTYWFSRFGICVFTNLVQKSHKTCSHYGRNIFVIRLIGKGQFSCLQLSR